MGDRLKDRVAVVTGAAQGNGRAFSEAFADEGARVVVVDIHKEGAERTAQEIGRGAVALEADVSSAVDAVRIIEDSVSLFGRVDVFVNNAGLIGRLNFLDISEAEWDRVMNVNLKGTFLCGQAAARQMVAQGSGSIINVASVNAESLNPTTIHYCVSKGAIQTLTKGMALALARRGVRVNAIGPGAVHTDLSRERLDDADVLRATLARIPMGRIAEPSDLKGAAVFLASDESAYVTGITLFVDGGWLTI